MFSGFSGSGKSTQLRRLQADLEAKGYLVVYANAQDYLNLGEPIAIEELLITIVGAFSDNLAPSLLKESYWDRLVNYLVRTEVQIGEATFKMSSASFKAELKTSPTFRQRVRKALESRLPEVRNQMDIFMSEAVKSIEARTPGQRTVFLFDSFEKYQGTPSNEEEIMASIERLFGSYLEMLQLSYIHCVYSVPAFVRYLSTCGELVLIPSVKLWRKRPVGQMEQTPHEPGFAVMREIVAKRFGSAACRRIFGEPDQEGRHPALEKLIEASGGALRDLFRLLRETLLAAQSLPVSDRVVDQAVAVVRDDFKTSIEDARWLDKIHREQAADLQTSKAADVKRYMRLLDSHLILYYMNNTSWYDTHPLVREEVKRILALNPEPPAPAVQVTA